MTDSRQPDPEAGDTFAQAFSEHSDDTAIVDVDGPSQQVVLFQLSLALRFGEPRTNGQPSRGN